MFANCSAMVAIGVVLTVIGFVRGFGADGLVIVGYLRRIARALEARNE